MVEQPTAGVLIIGDEILRGQVIDRNTSYLATSLRSAGVKLRKVVVVPDIIDEIAEEVSAASKRYSVVFTSGGVGPTHDDVTYVAVAKSFGLELEERKELVEVFAQLFPEQLESRRLAIVPSPCELIYVPIAGTAGGLSGSYPIVKITNVYILPGSPKFFKQAVDMIVPQLQGAMPLSNEFVDVALDELSIVSILDELVKHWTGSVDIGSYPQRGTRIFTRITLEGTLEAVSKAKEEFLSSLPSSDVTLSRTFSMKHVQAVIGSTERQEHVKNALKVCLIGTRKSDPGSEHLEPFTSNDSEWPPMMHVCPIFNWSSKQVWQFLLEHEVPYCPLYDRGYTSFDSKATAKPNHFSSNKCSLPSSSRPVLMPFYS